MKRKKNSVMKLDILFIIMLVFILASLPFADGCSAGYREGDSGSCHICNPGKSQFKAFEKDSCKTYIIFIILLYLCYIPSALV